MRKQTWFAGKATIEFDDFADWFPIFRECSHILRFSIFSHDFLGDFPMDLVFELPVQTAPFAWNPTELQLNHIGTI